MVRREFFKPAAAFSTATRSTLSIVLHELRSMPVDMTFNTETQEFDAKTVKKYQQ